MASMSTGGPFEHARTAIIHTTEWTCCRCWGHAPAPKHTTQCCLLCIFDIQHPSVQTVVMELNLFSYVCRPVIEQSAEIISPWIHSHPLVWVKQQDNIAMISTDPIPFMHKMHSSYLGRILLKELRQQSCICCGIVSASDYQPMQV